MKCTRSVVAVALLWLCTMPLAWADTTAPDGEPSPTAITQIDTPVDTGPPTVAPVAPEPTSAPESTPVVISQEHSTPVTQVQVPTAVVPTSVPVEQPTAPTYAPGRNANPITAPTPQPQTAPQNNAVPAPVSTASPPPDLSIPVSPPPDQPGVTLGDSNSGALSSASYLRSAEAPAQLTCSGKAHPDADPFLVSPYAGWTEVASFDDHDRPDYEIDGKIVLANGLTATSSDGVASDLFPAYWSPTLRQFINYDGHNGYDFEISYQPVLAAASGTVAFAGWNGPGPYDGYGQMVLINHHNGYTTLYGHLSELDVKTGDTVTAGQKIGISGSTGHSSGPHLHFSVFHDCNVTDPYGWTGTPADPLKAFGGDTSTYLWLPGHDPLLLNPPPNWPTYPLGLHLNLPSLAAAAAAAHVAPRAVPPVDRLLLLALPTPEGPHRVSASIALSRTEATIAEEAEALKPQLDDLVAQGLLQTYQVIPAAAAVWIRGTATAAQLEGLPGAASLTGVKPRDLYAAQAGLAHAVLIQTGHQEAPSLWPVGFRSALHAWRPISTVMDGHALVAGVALPGQHVVVTLHRGDTVAGASDGMSDPETGGFVTTLHDMRGNPVPAQAGDTIVIQSGGRVSSVRVQSLLLRARAHRLSGVAPAGSTVSLAVGGTSDSASWHAIATSDGHGQYQLDVPRTLAGGTGVVASVSDTAGDQESVSAFVPGVTVAAGDTEVTGWTVANGPVLRLARAGKVLIRRPIQAAADGTFQIGLVRAGKPFVIQAGDAISIGSRWHHRQLTIPTLRASLSIGRRDLLITGPPKVTVRLDYTGHTGSVWSRSLRLDSRGRVRMVLPGGPAAFGDTCVVSYITDSGDTIQAQSEATGLVLHEGRVTLTGQTRRGAVVSVHVLSHTGNRIGGAVATADATTGTFLAPLHTGTGKGLTPTQLAQITLSDGVKTLSFSPPRLQIRLGVDGEVTARGPLRAPLTIEIVAASGRSHVQRVVTDASGLVRIPPGSSRSEFPVRATVSYSGIKNLVVDRTATLRKVSTATPVTAACVRAPAKSPSHARCRVLSHNRKAERKR